MIQGTCGRTFFDLSARVNPRSLWVNRLQARLGMVGSTEFDLTWKVKDTPAKGSIFRLAPSTRRTSDRDCIGSQWPTPKASDGEGGRTTKTKGGGNSHLPIHAREAATWPTPTTRDGKDGSYCPNVPENALLGRTVWNGDEAQMEKRGALNPAFVCWLMGFPQEWDDCGATVTRSSRKSRQK